MPIIPEDDTAARTAAYDAARDYVEDSILRQPMGAEPRLSRGFVVRRAAFSEAENQRAAGTTSQTGWRFFVLDDELRPRAAIHVEMSSGNPSVTHFTHDDSVAIAADALARIEDTLGEREARISFMSVPSLFFEAIRVEETSPWFVPIEVRCLSPEDVTAILAARAASRIEALSPE